MADSIVLYKVKNAKVCGVKGVSGNGSDVWWRQSNLERKSLRSGRRGGPPSCRVLAKFHSTPAEPSTPQPSSQMAGE